MTGKTKAKAWWRRLARFIGPGFVSGASGDDPAGIATFSQAGAGFGYAMGWTMLFSFPLMSAVQYISGSIGAATGKGLAGNLRHRHPAWVLRALAILVFLSNTITVGADIGAMGAATGLLVPLQPFVFVLAYGILSVVLIALLKYESYSRYLKWLGLSLLAYVASAAVAGTDWQAALSGFFLPSFSADPRWIAIVVAILGTSISPYLVFWEASEEVQREKDKGRSHHRKALKRHPVSGPREQRRLRADTIFGMGISQLVGAFIIVTCAATLNTQGHTDIKSAAEAAAALRPIAGQFASFIFAAGIIGTGLLAVPVLAGSAGFALGEEFGWKVGLDLTPKRAKAFYGIIALATGLGVALNLVGINVIDFLIASAIINGIVELPVIVMMMLVARDRTVMGDFALTWPWKILGWLTLAVMAAAAAGMLLTL
jgi:NRAMP (natural resistance-associated macrophage protein)-like metal ion transporter